MTPPLVDLLKVKGITAMFCSLTYGNAESATTDTKLSRGTPHSNPLRRFIMSSARLALREVYIGPEGIRTSSACVAHEARLPMKPASAGGQAGAASRGEAVLNTRCVSIWKARKMRKKADDSLGYNLRLYVAGQTPKSIAAICNLRRLCEKYLSGRYRLDVIDLMVDPKLAQRDQIIAVPTLVRHVPEPIKRIIGDLSNSERVLTRLGIDVGAKA